MKQTLVFLFTLFCLINIQAQGDAFQTKKGDLTVHPILHATMVLEWDGKTIFVDPYGGAERLADFGDPDIVIITDIHGDHMNKETLEALNLTNTDLIAPKAVVDELAGITFRKTYEIANGKKAKVQGIKARAIPMYNLPETPDSRHPKGRGNGYVLDFAKTTVYLSGDTEDIPEMRSLKKINIAFVCMNLPYTMDEEQAASAVAEFKPDVVFPYHYRGGGGKLSDLEKFKSLVNAGGVETQVRIRDWYKE
ncbi:MAG: MBL fold metallo-hydrolase [Bacteroidetes bacterium]|nr:MBL fold metallo-hydrolase [Bacteroidota bacterium]MCB0845854.1 MBL fold metallo-hydrolase [Bacteroidota bacterium]MCB0855693.1 MBL fold metallo-hydrolase [Bacteroidota bacterium]